MKQRGRDRKSEIEKRRRVRGGGEGDIEVGRWIEREGYGERWR